MGGKGKVCFIMKGQQLQWFAFRTLWRSQDDFLETMKKEGVETWLPERTVEEPVPTEDGDYVVETRLELIFPALVFVKTTFQHAKQIQCDPYSKSFPYRIPGTPDPAPIPDRDMEQFIQVTKLGCITLQAIDINFAKGDKVRVTGGIFQGMEGYITRVKGTKRFVVTIEGVVAVATSYIPRCYLEKIEPTQ